MRLLNERGYNSRAAPIGAGTVFSSAQFPVLGAELLNKMAAASFVARHFTHIYLLNKLNSR